MLKEVVDHGTGKNAQLEGYTAGGKTGTAQIAKNGSYANGTFVASFIGMAPMSDPQLRDSGRHHRPQGRPLRRGGIGTGLQADRRAGAAVAPCPAGQSAVRGGSEGQGTEGTEGAVAG